MSLATKCPHCRTTFKVAKDQLKLQNGLVRCGICQKIFNGNEQLFDSQQVDLTAQDSDPEYIAQPLPKKADDAELQQLSFIRQAHTKKRVTRLFLLGIVALLFLMVAQATYLLRNVIAAAYPPANHALVTLCKYARCQIQQLTQLDALSYEGAQLHTLPRENTFEFSLLMRNQSALRQAWPYIELSLQNAQKRTVLKRIFTPADYLTNATDVTRGFAAHQEHAVRLYFELDQVHASDYAAALFYP